MTTKAITIKKIPKEVKKMQSKIQKRKKLGKRTTIIKKIIM